MKTTLDTFSKDYLDDIEVLKEIEKENNLQTIFLEIIGCMNEYIEKKQKISTKRDVNLNTQEKMLQINKNNEN